jgi:hypothetical protein
MCNCILAVEVCYVTTDDPRNDEGQIQDETGYVQRYEEGQVRSAKDEKALPVLQVRTLQVLTAGIYFQWS